MNKETYPLSSSDEPESKHNSPERKVSLRGVLYITSDPENFKSQLKGATDTPNGPLLDEISTDHIIRVAHLLTDDMNLLGDRAMLGLETPYGMSTGGIRDAKKEVLVAGERFGRGSSREQAAWALKYAGIKAVFANSFGPIFEKNAAFTGLLTTTDMSLLERIKEGEDVAEQEFAKGKNKLMEQVTLAGGLFPYLEGITTGTYEKPRIPERTSDTKMNVYEQRLARAFGASAVQAGDFGLLPVDLAYSYVGLSGLARAAMMDYYKTVKSKLSPEQIYLFEDHFAYSSMPEIPGLTRNQRAFAEELQLPAHNYYKGRYEEGGGAGISHRVMVERIDPRKEQVVVATDSHTPTIGALPILGLPVGSTVFGAALGEKKIPYAVEGVTRVELSGRIPRGYSIRDAQLELAHIAKTRTIAPVIEYGGNGMNTLSFDAVSALCNMTPEIFNAEVATTEAFRAGIAYLCEKYGMSEKEAEALYGYPDVQARYSDIIRYNMNDVSPWIALPGSPNNAIPLKGLDENPRIDKAFLVSCTLGMQDLIEAAAVMKGKKVQKGTQLIIVPSSNAIREAAYQRGIIQILQQSGATVVEGSACGPCIGAGLGQVEDGEVAISASNRNFPGRMGSKNAKVFLGGSMLTAFSAIQGRIPSADEYNEDLERIVENLSSLGAN